MITNVVYCLCVVQTLCLTRLPFGIASALAVFQRTMESLLQGLRHVTVYLDDILVTGMSEEDHISNLREVLKRLEAAGVRLHRDKCTFMSSQGKYLGHVIDAKGLHPNPDRATAIQDAPSPTSVTELKSLLPEVSAKLIKCASSASLTS